MKTIPMTNPAFIYVRGYQVVELPSRISRHKSDAGWVISESSNSTLYISDNDYGGCAWQSLRMAFKLWMRLVPTPSKKGTVLHTKEMANKKQATGSVGVFHTGQGYVASLSNLYRSEPVKSYNQAKKIRRDFEKHYLSIWGYNWQRYAEILDVPVTRKFKRHWT